MYGTVARMQAKPGMLDDLRRVAAEQDTARIEGAIFEYVYQMDDDPNAFYLVVGFENKEAYVANAQSPAQNERYLELRALLASDPEWHDGMIMHEHHFDR